MIPYCGMVMDFHEGKELPHNFAKEVRPPVRHQLFDKAIPADDFLEKDLYNNPCGDLWQGKGLWLSCEGIRDDKDKSVASTGGRQRTFHVNADLLEGSSGDGNELQTGDTNKGEDLTEVLQVLGMTVREDDHIINTDKCYLSW
uniref:Uncharacterized protein n=1 Tax=Chromera velia CCMP2878 TaxID=1169474 RepID=A0A0G4HPP2_9ALVE|eukprot:Cvel_29837.t1-p1 / transcript=Cvel_29837.t1 / gene=Cvel_29837 / organism=Chromera_velia_CCMP2878 / gene_product=Retrovirus-related Pol polyprotein from transposon, putative / transcript_product=Retrovirus-related Pol polyprotein from transposon, putative / location=Cvel_scaffold4158:3678-6239(-) / protein_length=142 / sequence_SO=supercontig / SO=protein_coding / is_pseudo=false